MTTRNKFLVLHGGRFGQPMRLPSDLPPYQLDTNEYRVTYVWFRWSPKENLFDFLMPLDEAVNRGFVPAPRVQLTVAARSGVGR